MKYEKKKKNLKSIIVNTLFTFAAGAYIGVGALIAYHPKIQEFTENCAELVEKAYQKAYPTLKEINSAIELTSMCYFGVWDPEWKAYKKEKESK
ncbi:hypothetical protein AYK26_01625 [Euryarchaeota archaeon SM23-78]|nr:MAG: hypothetical protein AYK26_01625 [Euryarchaeota archaeon SM23-78]MBW3000478.1 hypothetical protein [Candidatus Woesearchaeota archaeon]